MNKRLKHTDLTFPTSPAPPPVGPTNKETNPKIAAALEKFFEDALKKNSENLSRSMKFIDESFTWLRIAYSGMLIFGMAALVASCVEALGADGGSEVGAAAVLGGLSVGTLISAFVLKPTDSMERNSVYVPWMLLVLNTYWTRLLYMSDPAKIGDELKEAGNTANEQMKVIAEMLAKAQAGDEEVIEKLSQSDAERLKEAEEKKKTAEEKAAQEKKEKEAALIDEGTPEDLPAEEASTDGTLSGAVSSDGTPEAES